MRVHVYRRGSASEGAVLVWALLKHGCHRTTGPEEQRATRLEVLAAHLLRGGAEAQERVSPILKLGSS